MGVDGGPGPSPVLISVTTIPAIAEIGVGIAFGDSGEVLGAAAQLGINLVCLVAVGVVTLRLLHRMTPRLAATRLGSESTAAIKTRACPRYGGPMSDRPPARPGAGLPDAGGPRAPAGGLTAGVDLVGVVLVEGVSDQRALETLARRRDRDLGADGIAIVPMGGATSISRFLELYGPQGLGVELAGLCDAGEEGDFARGLQRAGLGTDLTRADMERLGFYTCQSDLEEELIRSLGADAVERVVAEQGDLGALRTLQKQPAWRGRDTAEQLRRFMGSGGSRKIRYASLLVDALDLDHVPRPLDGVLAHVTRQRRSDSYVIAHDLETGLPVVSLGYPVTAADVAAVDDQ